MNMSQIYILMLICKLWMLEEKDKKSSVFGEISKKSVYYIGSKLWNDLDENIRDIKELGEFKKNINAIFIDG